MNKSVIRSLHQCAAIPALMVAGIGTAQAQDATADAEQTTEASAQDGLGDIIVTAQRRSESLQDVPISITAFGTETLQTRGITSVSDLARVVPGFQAAESGLNTPIYTLRGIGFNESSLSATSTVSIYVDEVAIPFPAMTLGATLDLERVEVVKGPQGTLYGQNTTGGAINYIAAKPTDMVEGGVTFGFGRFNAVETAGYLSGPITDTLKARLAVRTDNADDWQRSQLRPGDGAGQVNRQSGRLTLEWEPAPTLRTTLVMSGWRDRSDTQVPQIRQVDPVFPEAVNPDLAAYPIAPEGDVRAADWDEGSDFARDNWFWQASGRVDWDLSPDITLSSITAYARFKDESFNEYDGTPVTVFDFTTFGRINSFQQELRLTGSFEGLADWVVGGNYARSTVYAEQTYRTGQTSANRISGVQSAENFTDQTLKSFAAFASIDWQLTDKLTLTTAARYTDFKVDFRGCSGDTGDNTLSPIIQFVSGLIRTGAGLAPLPASQFQPGLLSNGNCTTFVDPRGDVSLTATPGLSVNTLAEDNVSWRVALNYKPVDDLLFYVSASQGYKSGSFPNVAATGFRQYEPATQEKLIAYEAGVKASFGRTAQANAAVFYYDYTDKQLRGTFLDEVFGPLSLLINIPKSHIVGFEVDTTVIPTPGLKLTGAAAYLDTRIDEYVGLDVNGVLTDYEGGVLSFAPKWSLDFDGQYDWDVGNLGFFVGGSWSYRATASAVFGEDPRLDLPSYDLLGLRAGFGNEAAGWRLTFWGENVTNSYYFNNVLPQFDTIKAYVGRPATYGVRLNYDF
ncbi:MULTISPECIES: TonB-dependent receptor [unclassified Sphingomonas]|jgi:outer membrane receptor protein involved in Fe transport|uniref:TonB-dependent receptor n=1 Tax=unclassified Sphingomonas TaxID=196159 RepID=UPI00082A8B6A|nr:MULTISPECIES: TonB-dependent receptor [unclassified Sphingomonas]